MATVGVYAWVALAAGGALVAGVLALGWWAGQRPGAVESNSVLGDRYWPILFAAPGALLSIAWIILRETGHSVVDATYWALASSVLGLTVVLSAAAAVSAVRRSRQGR